MGLSLGKKPGSSASASHTAPAKSVSKPAASAAPTKTQPSAQAKAPAKAPAESSKPAGFLKKGQQAQEEFAKVEHQIEQNKKNKFYRFFVKEGQDASVTFIDGNLVDGVLDIPFLYEHNINMNGKWGNFFICTQDQEPCPICEGGSMASYVGIMTVIDHSEYKSSKDGKTYKDTVKLFVAKRETIKTLQKLAAKRGGLAGWRIDISRTGDKSASVGNVFDFTEHSTPEELQAVYGEKAVPIDYEAYFGELYMPAKELRKMGFGSATGPVGSESAAESDYEGDL